MTSPRPIAQRLIAAAYRWSIATFIVGLVAAAGWGGEAAASVSQFRDVQVEVIGQGRPVLMIPGLNSGADTWRDTCAALQAQRVQCHLVHLPGFAGRAAAPDRQGDFLADMRDRLLAYVADRGLERPVVVGHSLGGVLALQMALKQPAAFERLVIVDSLPFFPALRDPATTAATARPMADAMRAQMLAQDAAAYEQGIAATARGMVHDAAHTQKITDWGRASDRSTTAEAMHAMMVTDLRAELAQLRTPTLVLGSWAAYAPFGSTLESTAAIFRTQYAALPGVRIEMSQAGYHFLMWDDPQWLQAQVHEFLGTQTH
ncbi:alpha/beta fold hydrolase [Agrilutibacter solisilvae]|uniref:Alpha/beta hydrolase n=1 Tax=Agrilutibacter solisilvae TaxID=2763317 RepID=A0A974XZD9_9GAMM|nr:alpha/beta hydrolase [Lysobacter solisilvae]QSX78596.1 alpha/beta hydrolase [Lysobacter solisilvae]